MHNMSVHQLVQYYLPQQVLSTTLVMIPAYTKNVENFTGYKQTVR